MPKNLIPIIKRKGYLESAIYISKLFLNRLTSILKIFFLRLRGYDLDYSVVLRGGVFFFQSTKHAINIAGGIIGGRCRISAGGEGKIKIGKGVLIDDSTFIMAHENIKIGKNTTIASFCFITDFNHRFQDKDISVLKQGYITKPVIIGNNVWIGTHCIILPGVKIGEGSVIGAGSVVTNNIPQDSIAVGNPAKVIKKIKRN